MEEAHVKVEPLAEALAQLPLGRTEKVEAGEGERGRQGGRNRPTRASRKEQRTGLMKSSSSSSRRRSQTGGRSSSQRPWPQLVPQARLPATLVDNVPNLVPAVVVWGVGRLAYPLCVQQAAALVAVGEPAPYGKGSETVLDPTVRRATQVDASLVAIYPSWDPVLHHIKQEALSRLGVADDLAAHVEARLYKLLLYEPGGHFTAHRDTEKEAGMFATLIIQLPAGHQGGALEVTYAGQRVVWDSAAGSDQYVQCAAFFADCEHQLHPITAGLRLVLVYNLVRTSPGPTPRPVDHSQALDDLDSAVAAWERSDRAGEQCRAAVKLEHCYTQANLSFEGLKGRDKSVVDLLRACGNLEVHLALVTKHVLQCVELGCLPSLPGRLRGPVTDAIVDAVLALPGCRLRTACAIVRLASIAQASPAVDAAVATLIARCVPTQVSQCVELALLPSLPQRLRGPVTDALMAAVLANGCIGSLPVPDVCAVARLAYSSSSGEAMGALASAVLGRGDRQEVLAGLLREPAVRQAAAQERAAGTPGHVTGLVVARVAALVPLVSRPPEVSWEMPTASLPGYPQVEAFLRGPKQQQSFHLFTGLPDARHWAHTHFGRYQSSGTGYSADAFENGTGKRAYCIVKKTPEQLRVQDAERLRQHKAHVKDLQDLLALLPPPPAAAPPAAPPPAAPPAAPATAPPATRPTCIVTPAPGPPLAAATAAGASLLPFAATPAARMPGAVAGLLPAMPSLLGLRPAPVVGPHDLQGFLLGVLNQFGPQGLQNLLALTGKPALAAAPVPSLQGAQIPPAPSLRRAPATPLHGAPAAASHGAPAAADPAPPHGVPAAPTHGMPAAPQPGTSAATPVATDRLTAAMPVAQPGLPAAATPRPVPATADPQAASQQCITTAPPCPGPEANPPTPTRQ